jgi:hypothetical protein
LQITALKLASIAAVFAVLVVAVVLDFNQRGRVKLLKVLSFITYNYLRTDHFLGQPHQGQGGFFHHIKVLVK